MQEEVGKTQPRLTGTHLYMLSEECHLLTGRANGQTSTVCVHVQQGSRVVYASAAIKTANRQTASGLATPGIHYSHLQLCNPAMALKAMRVV